MSLTIPSTPDPQGARDAEGNPTETLANVHWQIDLIQIGGTAELAKEAPDLSRIVGRAAGHVYKSLAAAQGGSPPVAVEEYRFGDGVIAPYEEALAAGMAGDPRHLKLLQAQTLLKEWIEEQVIANRHSGATVNGEA